MAFRINSSAFLLLLSCFIQASDIQAEPISFRFDGLVTKGTLDSVSLDGQAFVIEGFVTNETNVSNYDCCGIFAADQTIFRFDGGDVFPADDGTMYFSQQNIDPFAGGGFQITLQAGSPNFFAGMFGNGSNSEIYVNPMVPEAVGFFRFNDGSGVGNAPILEMENSAGQGLTLVSAAWQSFETRSVPEPFGVLLFWPFLGLLLRVRKRSR